MAFENCEKNSDFQGTAAIQTIIALLMFATEASFVCCFETLDKF